MSKPCKHFSCHERDWLANLQSEGLSLRKISQTIKRSPRTFLRELKRMHRPFINGIICRVALSCAPIKETFKAIGAAASKAASSAMELNATAALAGVRNSSPADLSCVIQNYFLDQ